MRARSPHLALVAAVVAVVATLSCLPATSTAAGAVGDPRGVDVDVRSGGAPAFTVSWSPPTSGSPTSYEVVVDGVVRATVDGATRRATVEGLKVGGTYGIVVRSVDDDGTRSDGIDRRAILTYGAASPRLAANPTNPLAGREWGVHLGRSEPAYEPWLKATGATKDAIGRITLQPKAKWFGSWIPDGEAQQKVTQYLDESTRGDRAVLSQMTLYRAAPWGAATHQRKPNAAEWKAYQRYVNGVAAAIGDRPMAVVLQPDGAWMQGAPRGPRSIYAMVRWSANRLSALPNTAVYLEIGSPDWLRFDPARAVRLLRSVGIKKSRGFALSVTHMDSTESSVRYGARVVDALAKAGIAGKHFVVDTSDNGRGFTVADFRKVYPASVPIGAAKMCRTATQKLCVALGVPPTTDVANPRWGMPADVNALAAKHVDAYLWVDRPWLHWQIAPFVVADAVALAAQNPFA